MTAVHYTGLGDFRKAIDKYPIYSEAGIPGSAEGPACPPLPAGTPVTANTPLSHCPPGRNSASPSLTGEDNGLGGKQQVGQKGGSYLAPTRLALINHLKIQERLNPQKKK